MVLERMQEHWKFDLELLPNLRLDASVLMRYSALTACMSLSSESVGCRQLTFVERSHLGQAAKVSLVLCNVMPTYRELYWWMCAACVVLSVVLSAWPANRWRLGCKFS